MDFSNIAPGSTVLLHSSYARFYRRTKMRPEKFLDLFLERLGSEGTLLLPLFNFDFTRGVPFDIRTTPSQMGNVTEAARHRNGGVRTGHPVYSFVAIGAKAPQFEGIDNFSGYGSDSPFAMLRRLDADIAVLDLPDQHSMTFYHHVEEMCGVEYRAHKNFDGRYTDVDGIESRRRYSIFVRRTEQGVKTSVNRMGSLLWQKGIYRGDREKQGTGLRIASANAIYEATAEVINAGKAKDYLYEID
ncbi:AAC(3) family N-acetyltransferase (plasmid) [Agrobacterium salinitolerans]|uniref:AAC(3) family N-acetyltransferase n=1 Tax=Agrobacterium salinitolerans TaxID=1183413 RepID=UPI001C24DF97|nr:AAC(3) family N-acetyltransferase [Agrobacterium salinitolerans]